MYSVTFLSVCPLQSWDSDSLCLSWRRTTQQETPAGNKHISTPECNQSTEWIHQSVLMCPAGTSLASRGRRSTNPPWRKQWSLCSDGWERRDKLWACRTTQRSPAHRLHQTPFILSYVLFPLVYLFNHATTDTVLLCVQDMTQAQMVLEKITLQKCLLYFESLHGRPVSRQLEEQQRNKHTLKQWSQTDPVKGGCGCRFSFQPSKNTPDPTNQLCKDTSVE